MYRKSVKKLKKERILQYRVISNIILNSFYNQTFRVSPQAIFFWVLMNYSWTKTLVQEQFAWNLSSCLTKIWISPTLQVGWSGLPKHQLMLDFIFPPNLSELPFLVIPMTRVTEELSTETKRDKKWQKVTRNDKKRQKIQKVNAILKNLITNLQYSFDSS